MKKAFRYIIASKVSKCGVFFGLHFPVFALNTEIYSVSQSVRIREKTDQKKTPYLGTFYRVHVFVL